MTKSRVVFFGNERIATGTTTTGQTLTALIDKGYDVCAVVVSENGTTSRNTRELEVQRIASINNIPFYSPASLKDFLPQIQSFKADVGVLAAFGKMVPESIINSFPFGIINIHPSLLPKHRGSIPIESALLHGDAKTGVSIMHLVKKMDAGPVYAFSELPLNGHETKQALADQLLSIGSTMLVEILPDILSGAIVATSQDESCATYDQLISKNDGILDFTKPAVQLEREVRAFAEWPKSRTNIAGKDVVVTAAHFANTDQPTTGIGQAFIQNKELCIQTSDGIFVIDSLKPAGKSDMLSSAFLAGYGKNI